MAGKRGFFGFFSSKNDDSADQLIEPSSRVESDGDDVGQQFAIVEQFEETETGAAEPAVPIARVSDESRRRQQALVQMRSDVRAFDEELERSELFAVKTRKHLDRFNAFFQEAESELEMVTALKADLTERNGDVQQLTFRLHKAEEELADRESLLVSERNRVVELRGLLEVARAKASALSESGEASAREVADLIRVRDELESRAAVLDNRVADLSAELRIVGEGKERLERENARLAEENIQHEATALELERTQAQLVTQRDRSLNEVQERNVELGELRSDLLEFRSRTTSLEQELASQERHGQARLRSREEEVTLLKSEIEKLHSQVTVRTQMFKQAQDAMHSAKAAAKVARDTAAEMETRLVESNIAREDDQRDLLNRSSEIVEMNARILDLVNRLDASQRDNENLRKIQQVYNDRLRQVSEREDTFDLIERRTTQGDTAKDDSKQRKRKLQ
ncbi:hypothetical protein N9H93_01535 [Rhizobiaceae bacterium]|nr:hypothetical protein [Rhizobiaceae bacterium]